jgi:hypothetical protein
LAVRPRKVKRPDKNKFLPFNFAKKPCGFFAKMSRGSIPLYHGNSQFISALEKSILFPVQNPTVFDHCLVPVRRTLAVYGREGMRKGDVVKDFCSRHGIDWKSIDVVFGATGEAADAFNMHYAERTLMEQTRKLQVIIIDHADILAFEPSDEETMAHFALQLESKATLANLIVVCLFDRHRQDEEPNAYRSRFFKQFIYGALLTSPPADFRIKFYEEVITAFVSASAGGGGGKGEFTQGHYTMLSDASPDATIDDMLSFCKDVFYNYTFNALKDEKTEALSYDHFASYFPINGRIPTVALNASQLEQRLSASVLGVLKKEMPPRPAVAPPTLKREKSPPSSPPSSPPLSPQATKKHKVDADFGVEQV